MIRILMLVVTFALAAGELRAQDAARPGPPGTGEVRGRVVDASGDEPVVGASVAVWRDSTIVAGDVAQADGGFRVQGLAPGVYRLQITSIGHRTHRSPAFTIGPGALLADIGTVRLAAAPVEAAAIDVEIERPTVLVQPDRNSYSAKDIAPAASTASEVLESVPAVQVDTDGQVSLRGNENVAVHINGRPAPVQGGQLASYLQQLPAHLIDRVEVVPTPSARYDPEGMAGIINIVTKQDVDLGTSGGFTLAASPSERYNASGTFGYQRGPVTLFSTYGFNSAERTIAGINDRHRFDSLETLLSITEQDVEGEFGFHGHNLGATVDTRLSDGNVLTNIVSLNFRGSRDESRSAYTELDPGGTPLDRYNRLRDSESDNLVLDYTLGFKRVLEAGRDELAAELRFNRADDDDVTTLWRQPPGVAMSLDRTELELQDAEALNRELTSQVDYTRPLSERTKLETGYKGTLRWIERDFDVQEDELGTGEWVPGDLSNALEFDEHVEAGYAVLTHGAGEWELQGGLRTEYATRDFVLADAGTSFPHSEWSVFPSAVVLFRPNETDEAKVSYSRRIRRPNTHELNPFPVFFDVQNVFLGNPDLNPEFTHAIELGYTHHAEWGMWQLSPFYRRTTDVIRFIVDTDDVVDGREVTSISFENLDTGSSWGADVNSSFDAGWFDLMVSFNVFKMVTNGGSATSLSSNAVTWSTRLNATAEITPSLSLQGMTFYRAPMEFEGGEFSSWKMSTLTLNQKLWGDKASLSLRIVDPFDTMGFRVVAGDDALTQITERDFDARSVHLSFQYNFGKAPKVRRPRSEAGAEPGVGFPQ